MRCSYCYNKEIVEDLGVYSFQELEDFFVSRKTLLKGVVLCGGEPTIHSEIVELIYTLKELDYKIKLDTNGLHPTLMKQIIDENLVDFVALDFKAPKEKFKMITKTDKKLYGKFLETLQLLISSGQNFEVRTTFHEKLLEIKDIYTMLNTLQKYNYNQIFYLQNFKNDTQTIGNIEEKSLSNLPKILDTTKYNFPIKYRNFDINQ